MTSSSSKRAIKQPATPGGRETRAALLERAVRPNVPVRKVFVQRLEDEDPRHGPLKPFVTAGNLRALRAYLMVLAAGSRENTDGWATTLDSLVWARLFDAHTFATTASARTGAWRTLQWLQSANLIWCSRERGSPKITVKLLREDGSGEDYTRPDGVLPKDRFINLPRRFWTAGYDERLDMAGFAMLLAVAREKPWSAFPAEKMPKWYGWSGDTTLRGLKKLLDLGLVERREHYRTTPLSPLGSTMSYQYRLVSWMRPKARPRPAGEAKK